MRRRHFTLVEVLAAMAVLLVLMALVFSFFAAAQKAWTATDTNTRIYENARVAFTLISEDLQSTLASNEPGREIPFYLGTANGKTPPAANEVFCAFVTAVRPGQDAKARLCEIAYVWGSDGSLQRWRTSDYTGTGTYPNANWDFFGKTDHSWVSTSDSSSTLIEGVESVRFDVFTRSGAVAAGTTLTELPNAVRITMTLFDPRLKDLPQAERDKTKRVFSKLIFLSAAGQVY